MSYLQLFVRFLKFGLLAWGGPVAQIGMLRSELVDEERWISSERFNKLLAVMQVLPGPEAHELCVHLGVRAKGRLGGVLAGLGFMLPGFLLMFALSWLYFQIDIAGTALGAAFLGMQAAVISLIVRAVHRIGEHILLDRWLWAIAIACALAAMGGVDFWITLPAGGLVYALLVLKHRALALLVTLAAVALATAVALWTAPTAKLVETVVQGQASVLLIFAAGLKAGLLTFGGAYTAIPFIRDDAVGRGWLTDGQFLDGLALSGVLPAPLIIFATFVGYAAGGPIGAVAMTAGISIFAAALAFLYFWKNKLNVVVVILAAGLAGWLVFPGQGLT
jgi:chromate transporter